MNVSDLDDPPDPSGPGASEAEGRRPDKPERVSISIRFRADLAEELRRLAEEHSRSFNGTVIEACKRYVRQMKPRLPKEEQPG